MPKGRSLSRSYTATCSCLSERNNLQQLSNGRECVQCSGAAVLSPTMQLGLQLACFHYAPTLEWKTIGVSACLFEVSWNLGINEQKGFDWMTGLHSGQVCACIYWLFFTQDWCLSMNQVLNQGVGIIVRESWKKVADFYVERYRADAEVR